MLWGNLSRRRIAGGMAGIVAIATFGLFTAPGTGDAVRASAVAAGQSLAAMIGARSPGSRASGAQSKAKKIPLTTTETALVPDTGTRRRLTPRRPVPGTAIDQHLFSPDGIVIESLPEFALADLPGSAPTGGSFPFSSSGGGSGSSGGGIFGGGGGGGGGGSTGGGGGGPGGVVNPPTPALVPEPGTWLMMIFGFGAIGATLRRQRRVAGRVAQ